MKPEPESHELDWSVVNPVCALCARDCKQCAGVCVVGCAKFVRKIETKAPKKST